MKKLAVSITLFVLTVAFATSFAGEDWDAQRAKLVEIVKRQGIANSKVLAAMGQVKRHLFVPEKYRANSYKNYPLPIGRDQTISQPYVVAFMTEALKLKGGETVLEVGTGSGYQAAVLAKIVKKVYSIEIICELADSARDRMKKLGYKNVEVRCGDGYKGWPDHAPFDAIIVTAAPNHVPEPLVEQLKVGGRMIIPVGALFQNLQVIEKTSKGVSKKSILPVRFVPMTGPGVEQSK